MDQASSVNANATDSPALFQELDKLFSDLQGLAQSSSTTVSTDFKAQQPVNENAGLEGGVFFKPSTNQPTLEQQTSQINHQNDVQATATSQQQQQIIQDNAIPQKPNGTDGYTRAQDQTMTANTNKKQINQTLSAEDQDFMNRMLEEQALYEDDIPDVIASSEDFNEAFFNASKDNAANIHNARTEDPEDNQEREQDQSSSQQSPEKTYQLEDDEVVDLSLDHEIAHRIMSISEALDRKNGSHPALMSEIEKRIQKIGVIIDKKPAPAAASSPAKLFNVPTSNRVQKLRSKFGKR